MKQHTKGRWNTTFYAEVKFCDGQKFDKMAFCMISDNGANLPSALMKEILELRNQHPRLKDCMRERKTGTLDQKPFKRETMLWSITIVKW